MKKIVLAILLVIFSSSNAMADYVAGYLRCKQEWNGDSTFFIVRGKGANLSHDGSRKSAMTAFLNADYAIETSKYCYSNKLIAPGGYVYSFNTKAEANRHFSELINDYKDESYVSKIIIIKYGYDERDWR